MTKSEAFRNLLQSQELNDEMQEMQHELTELIINSDTDQQKVREDAYVRIKVINEIMNRFKSIAKDDEIKDRAWKILQAIAFNGYPPLEEIKETQ